MNHYRPNYNVIIARDLPNALFEGALHAFRQRIVGAELVGWKQIDLIQGRLSCSSRAEQSDKAATLRSQIDIFQAGNVKTVRAAKLYVSAQDKLQLQLAGEGIKDLLTERQTIEAITEEPISKYKEPKSMYLSLGGLTIYHYRRFNDSINDSIRAAEAALPDEITFSDLAIKAQ